MFQVSKVCGWMVAAVLAAALASGVQAEDKKEVKKDDATRKIQVAILLDTSNSMDGLINQARTQLWKVVGEFTTIRLGGQVPKLEVALYEYGNDGLPAQEGFIRMVVPFTTNLDKVSEAMFSLKTNGGEEYCGQVIDRATRQLTWSTSNKDVKCIFIAGNEPFTQGTFDFRVSCKAAATKGITVNTIFCGPYDEGVRTFWQEGAKVADGQYMNIDQNQQIAAMAAPQDKDLAQLGADLNRTYLPYGDAKQRAESARRQTAQDSQAAKAVAGVAASRAAFKASAMYRNADWDLVDAVTEGKVKLEELKDADLPEAVRNVPSAERKAYVEKVATERKEIQAKITKVQESRKVYLADQEKKLEMQAAKARVAHGTTAAAAAPAPAAAFDKAVIDAVKAEAAKK